MMLKMVKFTWLKGKKNRHTATRQQRQQQMSAGLRLCTDESSSHQRLQSEAPKSSKSMKKRKENPSISFAPFTAAVIFP